MDQIKLMSVCLPKLWILAFKFPWNTIPAVFLLCKSRVQHFTRWDLERNLHLPSWSHLACITCNMTASFDFGSFISFLYILLAHCTCGKFSCHRKCQWKVLNLLSCPWGSCTFWQLEFTYWWLIFLIYLAKCHFFEFRALYHYSFKYPFYNFACSVSWLVNDRKI